ncbi:MAG: DMT family transporter [Dehalococcoidia bacterium]|nr:DMT family transporter [Dehalococcoidia bacterium]MDW8120411.1 DMT family transporter [Chloroflexota bacterium]
MGISVSSEVRGPPGHRDAATYGALVAGVLAVSSAAVLIRLADAPALTVSTWRTGVAALAFLPLAWALHGRVLLHMGWRTGGLLVLSGVALAVHFAFWIASLDYTTVASSVVIVTSNPLLVAVLGWVFLGERPGRRVLVGIGVALVGGLVLGWGDFRLGRRELLGDGLALLGAVGVAVYYTIGRAVRPHLPLLAYIGPVYGTAALVLVGASLLGGAPVWGFTLRTLGFLLLVALLPQMVGHTLLNWTLGRLRAVVVSAVVMTEPVVATVLAWLVLGETPSSTTLVGGALILGGVWGVVGKR